MGADENLTKAITGQDAKYDGIRLTKSAKEWIECAMTWRWECLHAQQSSYADGREDAAAQNDYSVQKHVRATNEDSSSSSLRSLPSSGNDPDVISLWRTATLLQAKKLCSSNDNDFSLDSMLSPPGSDFSGRHAVQCWTTDLEGAKLFADYYQKIAAPAAIVLVKIEVPRSMLTREAMELRYAGEDWKQLVFSSREEKDPEPKALARKIAKAEVLIGHVSTSNPESVKGLDDWTEAQDKHLLRLPSGNIMTQVVFGHTIGGEIEEMIKEPGGNVTIHLM